jgi:hypothetical protein
MEFRGLFALVILMAFIHLDRVDSATCTCGCCGNSCTNSMRVTNITVQSCAVCDFDACNTTFQSTCGDQPTSLDSNCALSVTDGGTPTNLSGNAVASVFKPTHQMNAIMVGCFILSINSIIKG